MAEPTACHVCQIELGTFYNFILKLEALKASSFLSVHLSVCHRRFTRSFMHLLRKGYGTPYHGRVGYEANRRFL